MPLSNCNMNRKTIFYAILGFLQAFNGLSGLLGGYMLINDPTGNSLNLVLEWLQITPFENYLIPGIILFLFVGMGNVFGFWFTFKKKKKLALVGLVFGLILMVWILLQVALIGYKDFLQPLYFTSGMLQAVAGLALLKQIKKE